MLLYDQGPEIQYASNIVVLLPKFGLVIGSVAVLPSHVAKWGMWRMSDRLFAYLLGFWLRDNLTALFSISLFSPLITKSSNSQAQDSGLETDELRRPENNYAPRTSPTITLRAPGKIEMVAQEYSFICLLPTADTHNLLSLISIDLSQAAQRRLLVCGYWFSHSAIPV